MAGRKSKPVELLILEGKSHRTKEELEHRKKAEEALYTGENFKEEKSVKENPVAHKEFLRLKRLYLKISFVDALDQQMINRYCTEVANLQEMQSRLDKLSEDVNNAEDFAERLKIYELLNKILTAMHKSKELLLKYEDRLFLNPTSRIRAIPKQPPKEENPSGIAAFMKKRG